MPTFTCVVLDLDDTLYLERDYVRSGFHAVAQWVQRELGLEGFGAQAWAAFEAGARGDIFDRVLTASGVPADQELVQRLVAVYRAHVPEITLLPDARALLERLHGHVPLACVTDGPLQCQQAKAEALGLSRWLSPLVLTAHWGPGFAKPHPRAFLHVQEALGIGGEHCVYVGDNPTKDFSAPRALGWGTVRIRRPGGLHSALSSSADVDHELTDLLPLPALLALNP